MLKSNFIHPNEMKRRIKKEAITFRIDVATKDLLKETAEKYGLTLADLIAQVIENYSKELEIVEKNKKIGRLDK